MINKLINMKKNKTSHIIIFLILTIFISGCVEPIDIDESLKFENAIVIEATITNEYKYQEIFLSNSFSFDDNGYVAETNASVKIVDENQNTYVFHENSSGKYISINKFSAEPNKNYKLLITTKDGKNYESLATQLPNNISIGSIQASIEIDEFGNEGVSILVNSYDPTGNSRYYRYEYEETYKIIAPFWSPSDLIVSPTYELSLVPKTKEEQVCYNTMLSNTIIQTETNDLSEDRVVKFSVRNISKDNPIITSRYSILVRQYIQTLEAYTYYKTLKKLSNSGNIFSQNQPGFISGNIISVNNPNEKVIGYFELSPVSSKRIYFNYPDLFPNEPLPPYFEDCKMFATSPGSPPSPRGEENNLTIVISSGVAKYFGPNLDPELGEGPYDLVLRACGDCTVLGSNIKPDFWED